MNTQEQRQHKSRLDELTKVIDQVVEVVDQRLSAYADALSMLRHDINEERTHRLKLTEEQRSYVDGENRTLRNHMNALSEVLNRPSFWARLRWLFTGK